MCRAAAAAAASCGYSTASSAAAAAAAAEDPITPPVKVDYTQLLINGQFVDSASGDLSIKSISYMLYFLSVLSLKN